MTTELFGSGDRCHVSEQTDIPKPACPLDCRMLSEADYWDLLWTTIAEFPGQYTILSLFCNFFKCV